MNENNGNYNGSKNILDKGIRVWDGQKMIYLNRRYSLNFPVYEEPSASVLNGKTKVAKKEFMLRICGDPHTGENMIYDQDILEYEFKNELYRGVVTYNNDHMCWTVTIRDKQIPLYKAKHKKVIGNIFENPNMQL